MKIVSFSSTIVAPQSALFFKDDVADDPRFAAAIVYHPPGTVLDVDDDEGKRMVQGKHVVEWSPDEHGADPRQIASRMARQQTSAQQQGVHRHA